MTDRLIFHGWDKNHLIHPDATLPEPVECDHVATVTAPLHVTHGPHVYTTGPVTICCTCRAALPETTTEGA